MRAREPERRVAAQGADFENVSGACGARGQLEVFALGGGDGDVWEARSLLMSEGGGEGGGWWDGGGGGVEVGDCVGVYVGPAGVVFGEGGVGHFLRALRWGLIGRRFFGGGGRKFFWW